MNEKLFKSDHFLFIFRIPASNSEIIQFSNSVELRRKKILSILGYQTSLVIKNAIYIVNYSQEENIARGTSNSQIIRINILDKNTLEHDDNLMIHEETHFILLNLYPLISRFLNEGIAEYTCWQLTGSSIPMDFYQHGKHLLEVNKNMLIFQNDWMDDFASRGIWIYTMACVFITSASEECCIKELLENIYHYQDYSLIQKVLNKFKKGGSYYG